MVTPEDQPSLPPEPQSTYNHPYYSQMGGTPGAGYPPAAYPPGAYPPGAYPPGAYPVQPTGRKGLHPLAWVAIAVGVLVSMGIAAAIAIPVFLNAQRTPLKVSSKPVVAEGLTRYEFPNLHFAAGFANQPSEVSLPLKQSSFSLTVHAERDAFSKATVEFMEVSPPLPSKDRYSFLRGVADGAARIGNRHTSQKITLRGKPGVRVELTDANGTNFTMVMVVQASNRIFAVAAPSGTTFDDLLNSFEVLP